MGSITERHITSLRWRLIVQLGSMIIGLVVLSAGAIVGINGLHHDVGNALEGYQQLRTTYEIGQNVASARSALAGEPPDPLTAHSAIHAAVLRLETSREMALLGDRFKVLDEALDIATQEPSTTAMDAVLGQLAGISAEVRSRITAAQTNADAKRRATLLLIISLSSMVIAAGIVVGIQQYRSVMRPLRRLGDAVREVAAGRFSKPIDSAGDREFFELASDFNHMSSQLEALYRELEEKVRQKSKELVRSERLASVGYLAAGVAHEINNPLGIITGYGERAIRQLDAEGPGAASSRARKAIEVMCEEAYRCKQITDRLLSLARGGSETHGPVDLRRVAEEVISNVTALPEYGDRTIVLEANPRDALTVRGRDGEIKQVILNLLINALQASPASPSLPSPGTPGEGQGEGSCAIDREPSPNPLPDYRARGTSEVRVTIANMAEQIELTVIDHGRGMDSATLDRIFEPFFTSKRGEIRGTGLGLSITHAIITDHGGSIQAYSEGVGRGSRFVVRLPALEGAVHAER